MKPLRPTLAAAPVIALALTGWGPIAPFAAQAQTRGQGPAGGAFAREPRTPVETWEVIDYLLKVGQPEQAVPYLKRFVDANPDDATLLAIRDEYGAGSILRLSDAAATRPYARPLAEKLAAASSRAAADVTRIARSIESLTGTAEEQAIAVQQIRQAGSYAVAPMLEALTRVGRPADERALIARSLGRLDRKAVPALLAVLDAPDPTLVADAARALGQIRDPRAIPALTYLAARRNPESPAREAAEGAVARITGRPFGTQARPPVRVLEDVARGYQTHAVRFPGDPVVLWEWDADAKAPAARSYALRDAEARLGLRAARQALELAPTDLDAQATLIGLALAGDPARARASALAAGPEVLGRVVRSAIAEGRDGVAVTAIPILGEVTDRDALLAHTARTHPLVEALAAPDRRVQFAAAEALVKLDPRRAFSGSSRLVPAVARFLGAGPLPRALVVDGNPTRGAEIVGPLRTLGYDVRLAATGSEGFALAAAEADVELVVVDPNVVGGHWGLGETLANLRDDPRTAGIPVYVSGPSDLADQLARKLDGFPRVEFLVTPSEPGVLKGQIDRSAARRRYRPLTEAERADYARKAAALLADVARRPGSPFEADLRAAEPGLALALTGPSAGPEAARALGDIPGPASQRTLGTVALDSSRPAPLRIAAATSLARNVGRFGPKLVPEQERTLVEELARETDPGLRDALAAVVGSLRPGPDASGSRLRSYRAGASAAPVPAAPADLAPPAAATPDGTPAPAMAPPAAAEGTTPADPAAPRPQ